MSIEYCTGCGKRVDTDMEPDHYDDKGQCTIPTKKAIYVYTGKPLEIKEFEIYTAPAGWVRIESLQSKLKENDEYREQFSESELKRIYEVKA